MAARTRRFLGAQASCLPFSQNARKQAGMPALPGSVLCARPSLLFEALLLELDRNEFLDARLFHRDSVESARGFHRSLVVGNDKELRVAAHLYHLLREPSHVDLIKRRIDLVKYTERRRAVLKDRKHKRDSCHRLLSA